MQCRILGRGAPATVVEHSDVLDDRVRELDAGPPLVPVQQRDLHCRPEQIHRRIAETISDGAERGQQAR